MRGRADHDHPVGDAVCDQSRTKADLGLFAQDQWTIKRLTLNYGLRFDYFNGYVPATARRRRAIRGRPRLRGGPRRAGLDGSESAARRRPTTCSATAGRRSRRRSAGMWARWRPPSPWRTTRSTTSVNSVNRTWSDTQRRLRAGLRPAQLRRERRVRARSATSTSARSTPTPSGTTTT